MIVYFKCSFRSSHGFTMSMYDMDRKQLNFLSEKSNGLDNMIPKTVEYTLSYQLGRCLMLATDETGKLFFGVYRLIEGNDDKYVNAVFYAPEEQQKIIALFYYFCNHQYSAVKLLLDGIKRTDEKMNVSPDLEYIIEDDIIMQIISNSNAYLETNEVNYDKPNVLLAFITTDKYNDYQVALEDKFSVYNPLLCEQYNISEEKIINGQISVNNINSFISKLFFSPLSIAIGVSVVILGLIIILLTLLL